MSETLHTYENGAALAAGLADAVSARLAAALDARGTASIAVSGGATPKAFFRALAGRDLDWRKVTITLVDERFVPPESDRSNHALVASNLLQDEAAAAQFVPLYHAAATAEAAAAIASKVTAAIAAPFDVVVLGMGTDGHTASFFPGGTRLEEALDPATPRGVITMEADGAGEPRLTFTFSSLQDAGYLVLHIEGEGKREVLARAQASGEEAEMPIRAVLRRAASPLQIYWAP
ncbi:6-phosphogluconolactonase [Sinorhizobium americanum]|uniref:6-phosphogluconolactonase n=1 Tax=Sinorhizobium americanum TaxID=194963 RepID=A0A1L3LIT3_9HYPH|nr:6-phosphogluconolactonase [Sinorhizobium americanum]APG83496.1 6-phosphogluconolactonase [Sinorhizobium americanum CCGM7]APG90032.1 6-phosphogluconolactonase [Sinorhizobium americanum]OAP42374.1 6-phosphogluconolactonase [Sinorhizobium americanum]TCN36488.1 6-phosphogluconolactonase [Sinorhizobium americanum]